MPVESEISPGMLAFAVDEGSRHSGGVWRNSALCGHSLMFVPIVGAEQFFFLCNGGFSY